MDCKILVSDEACKGCRHYGLLAFTMLVLAFVIATLFADGITNPLTKLYTKIKNTDVANSFNKNK